jgi:hypothetical protein
MTSTVTGSDKIEKLTHKFAYPLPTYDQNRMRQQPPHYIDARPKQSSSNNYMNHTVCMNTTRAHKIQNSTMNCSGDKLESEKAKFLNILKSLFAVFDPECRGSIDINEIDKFSGKNSEILKDVINFIRTSNSTIQQQQPFVNYTNKKLKNSSQGQRALISFDEFVRASELVLTQRKQNKLFHLAAENMSDISQNGSGRNCALFSSSSSSSAPSSPTATTNATLSQAFESSVATSTSSSRCYQNVHKSLESDQPIDGINSYDLANLIDTENLLLKQGIDHIDSIKQFYLNSLVENRLKTNNINKLKHQNLFSIDRMLTGLNKLRDFNGSMSGFLKENSIENVCNEKDLGNEQLNLKTILAAPLDPDSSCYVNTTTDEFFIENAENLDEKSSNTEFDAYLKQKQERIENLQKEKSQLIRKLFEMKSEAESINKNLTKLQSNKEHSTTNRPC